MSTAQVAVVGGGPAGMAAAAAAAAAGAQTVLLDEHPRLGGQLRYRIAALSLSPARRQVLAAALAAELIRAAVAAGATLQASTLAWGLFRDNVLGVVAGAASYRLHAEQIVLATGSTDVPFPFVGGSLPGVMTARAVQILVNEHRVLPGERYVVLGGGDAAEVSADIRLAGGDVVATFDPAGNSDAIEAVGDRGVHAVILAGRRYEADVVVLALGRQPDPALALMTECAAGYAPALGGWVPIRDEQLRTSVPGILVAGDAAGVCDVPTALAEGRLAGLSAAAAVTTTVDDRLLDDARAAYEAIAPERVAVARGLSATYGQGDLNRSQRVVL